MKNITVAIDFNEESEDILRFAEDLARSGGAELHLVHVYPPIPESPPTTPYLYPMPVEIENPELHEKMIREEEEDLRKMVSALQEKKIPATGCMKPEQYDVAGTIREFARQKGSELIVMGSHRPGRLERLVLGSVAESVLRKAELPVLIIPRVRRKSDSEGGTA